MIILNVKGLDTLPRLLKTAKKNEKSALQKAARHLKKALRRGHWFDEPTGKLQKSFRQRLHMKEGGIDILWGVPYGPVLEWGPRNWSGWFVARYGKLYWRKWSPKSLRPHIEPAVTEELDTMLGIMRDEIMRDVRVTD